MGWNICFWIGKGRLWFWSLVKTDQSVHPWPQKPFCWKPHQNQYISKHQSVPTSLTYKQHSVSKCCTSNWNLQQQGGKTKFQVQMLHLEAPPASSQQRGLFWEVSHTRKLFCQVNYSTRFWQIKVHLIKGLLVDSRGFRLLSYNPVTACKLTWACQFSSAPACWHLLVPRTHTQVQVPWKQAQEFFVGSTPSRTLASAPRGQYGMVKG